jgi:hypothetical protein
MLPSTAAAAAAQTCLPSDNASAPGWSICKRRILSAFHAAVSEVWILTTTKPRYVLHQFVPIVEPNVIVEPTCTLCSCAVNVVLAAESLHPSQGWQPSPHHLTKQELWQTIQAEARADAVRISQLSCYEHLPLMQGCN